MKKTTTDFLVDSCYTKRLRATRIEIEFSVRQWKEVLFSRTGRNVTAADVHCNSTAGTIDCNATTMHTRHHNYGSL